MAPVDKKLTSIEVGLKWHSHAGDDHTCNLTKKLQEKIARDYSDTFNIPVTILRIGHVVDGKNALDITGNSPSNLTYYTGGWINKGDVANACFLAAKREHGNLEIFNIIGSQQEYKLFDSKYVKDTLGWKQEYKFI